MTDIDMYFELSSYTVRNKYYPVMPVLKLNSTASFDITVTLSEDSTTIEDKYAANGKS